MQTNKNVLSNFASYGELNIPGAISRCNDINISSLHLLENKYLAIYHIINLIIN